MNNLTRILLGFLCFATLSLFIVSTGLIQTQAKHSFLEKQLSDTLERASSLEVTKKELDRQIDTLVTENLLLEKDLKELKAKPQSVQTVTILVPGKETIIQGDFPEEYKYILENGLAVASHTYKDQTFTATTYDLGVNLVIIVSKTKNNEEISHVQSSITSSAEDETYPVETNSRLIYITPPSEFRLIDPHLNMGLSLGLPIPKARVTIGASISSFGPSRIDNIYRFGNTKLEIGKDLAIGIDPIGVNVSRFLNVPILQDTWIYGGLNYLLYPTLGPAHGTVSMTSTL